jgi:lipopolysaccharide/colanic/teichoic acid biosynthesis glycosyltransferase
MRKTSLDELPQLFNVRAATCRSSGPRPTSFAASTYSLWHTERLE